MNRLQKHLNAKHYTALWNLRDSIAQEIAPKVAVSIAADAKLERVGRPRGTTGGKVQGTSGRGNVHFYAVSTGGDDCGMADNSPLWTMGNALAERDAAKA